MEPSCLHQTGLADAKRLEQFPFGVGVIGAWQVPRSWHDLGFGLCLVTHSADALNNGQ
jgi:hypothetical protein